MLLFYVDIFILYGFLNISYIYIYCMFIISMIMFASTLYIYVCLTYYSFI